MSDLSIIQIILLSLIQALTEFLPISSSAHLLLPSKLLGWPDQGIVFDITVHFATLLAVLLYFKKDFIKISFYQRMCFCKFQEPKMPRKQPADYILKHFLYQTGSK